MEGSPATCISKTGQGNLEVGREPGFIPVSAGKDVLLRHVPLILSDVHVVELGSVAGLDLYLLGHFSVCIDPVTLEGAEDGPEAALLCFVATLQGLDHFPMAGLVLEVHIERRLDRQRFLWIDPFLGPTTPHSLYNMSQKSTYLPTQKDLDGAHPKPSLLEIKKIRANVVLLDLLSILLAFLYLLNQLHQNREYCCL